MKKILIIVIIFFAAVINVKSQSCNFLCNGDFENPQYLHWVWVADSLFPCWQTTESDSIIEVWWTGFLGVPAYHGNQFVELDANVHATVYQNFKIAPGTNSIIGFAHRGRLGVDTMTVSIGPVGGPYTTLGTYADGNTAWGYYTINYTIPLTHGNYYCLRLNSIYSTGGPGYGNFVDDISVSSGLVTKISSTNILCQKGGLGNASVTVSSGTPPYTYQWSPSGGTNSSASGLSAGLYTCLITDANGCSCTDSVMIVNTSPPTITVTPQDDTICIGGSVTLTATGAATYSWSPASGLSCSTCSNTMAKPSTTATYTVTGTDTNGCVNAATVTVYVADHSTVAATASRTTICAGTTVNLLASGTNITSQFTWQPGSLSGAIVAVTPSVTTTYTLTAGTGCGSNAVFVTIYVNPAPVTDFGADNISGCSPFCVQFRNKSVCSSGNIIQWRWDFGDGDSSNAENPIYCYPNPGNYPVTLTTVTDSGCSSTLDVLNYITVYSHPVAAFGVSPQPANVFQGTIKFTDQSTDAYGLTYWTWNFGVSGNDTLSYKQNPSYTYWDTGTYCPSEVVMNAHGCVDTITNCLVIDPVFKLFIPDAFTPNEDNLNEVFMAKGNDVKSFEMYIFDRWGQQIFHSISIDKGWNGTKGGGTICQEDTYVYLVTAYDTEYNKHTYIGKVTLLK